ncbi:DUF167 domain-containing protein [Leptolyngbya sp. AN02str]|uniref:DUF167 domain-containing protein n=1 Tax=Leptolyngbya sp. AN02str TaxID=3423363 RepID=UPI003D31934C
MAVLKKQVRVKPNAKQQNFSEEADGSLSIQLKSPPTDGKANQELIQLLAKTYGVPKANITIKLGLSSRNKVVEIEIPDAGH